MYQCICKEDFPVVPNKRRDEKACKKKVFFGNNHQGFILYYTFLYYYGKRSQWRSFVECILLKARKSQVQDTYFHQMPFKS